MTSGYLELERPQKGTKAKEGVNLEAEWARQAENLAALFANELGLTREGYIASLPKLKPQPEAFKGRFDIPVLVETRIPDVRRLCKLAKMGCFLDGQARDWPKEPKGYKTPKEPYVTWMQDGTKNLNKSTKTVRRELEEDERGGTVFDGIALRLAHPKILENYSLVFLGTEVGFGFVPRLYLRHGRPELNNYGIRTARPNCRFVTCGRG